MSKHDGWAIKGPDGKLRRYTFDPGRTESINKFAGPERCEWRFWKRHHFSCVKAKLVEVKE